MDYSRRINIQNIIQMIDWITISQDSGSGNATITVTADTYSQFVERTASLKVSTVSNKVTRYVTLIQDAETPFTVTPSYITVDGRGGTYNIEIQSDYGWTATTIPAWITLSSDSGSSGTTITASAGTHTGVARNGSITFQNAKGRTATVNLTQGVISVPTPPDNAIYYTVNDGEEPRFEWIREGWGANPTHSGHMMYAGGYWGIEFDAPIYWVPGWYEYLSYNKNATTGTNNINGIWFPKSIEMIGGCAFAYAGGIKKVVFPHDSNLVRVGTMAFDKAGIEELVFGDNTPFLIGYCAFNRNNLTSIHLGVTTRELGGLAFAQNSLSSITFDSATEPIYDEMNGSGPFYGNPSGGTLHIPSGASYTDIFVTGDLHQSWTTVDDNTVPSVAADYVWPTASHDMGRTGHEFYFGSSGFTYDTTEFGTATTGTCGNGYYLRVASTYNVDEDSAHTFTISNAQTATTIERGCRPAYPANNSNWTVPSMNGFGDTYPRTRTVYSKRFAFNLYNKVVNYSDYTLYDFNFEARKWELYAEDKGGSHRNVYARYKVIMENGQYYKYPDDFASIDNKGLKITVQ